MSALTQRWQKLLVTGGLLVATTAFVAHNESGGQVHLTAYRDSKGVPTICDGRIAGVHMGMTQTAQQCASWLTPEVASRIAFVKSVLKVAVPDTVILALADFAFNEGNTALANSTALRLINAGETARGCKALMRYSGISVHHKYQQLPGLRKRRVLDVDLCLVDQE